MAQNIFLTTEPLAPGILIDDREARAGARVLSRRWRTTSTRSPDRDLGTGYWQLTEIAKALAQDARVLIMDEPTSSLTRHEAEPLFDLVSRLKERGISIIYISHRMDEIFRITDRITVLRDGRHSSPSGRATSDQIIDAIVGQPMEGLAFRSARVGDARWSLLQVRSLSAGYGVQDVSFTLTRARSSVSPV